MFRRVSLHFNSFSFLFLNKLLIYFFGKQNEEIKMYLIIRRLINFSIFHLYTFRIDHFNYQEVIRRQLYTVNFSSINKQYKNREL